MKAIIIKSNSGNHSGFNRSWAEVAVCPSLAAAKQELLYIASNLSDDIVEVNGLPFDSNNNEVVYNGEELSFCYDGSIYMILTEDTDLNELFNGGYYGYMPKFIETYFNN